MSNYTEGDFLFIGAGDDILGGNELLLYGRQEGLQVVIPSDVGHVFFYSTTSVFNATGFNLTYTSIPMVTTQTPTTTASPIPTNLPETFVAINGIPVQEWRDHNDTFRRAIASMSTEYLHNMHYNYPENVTANLVYIHDIKTCHPLHCQRDNCVAYNFSVGVYIDGSVVFTREVLSQMLSDQSLQHHIPQNMKDCQICDEHPTATTWVYIVVAVGVITSALVLTLIFWKCSKMESSAMAREQYEKEQWEKREDQRRRSSGDVSILGLGTSLASQGSLNSRRFTMPFPKVGKEAQDDDSESLDMSGFREYDPDVGIVDPSHFGLGKEFVRDTQAIHYFTNEAFVSDEEVIYQRDGASCSYTDTDSNDSDDGGALSFHSSERHNKQPTRQIIVPADVHITADAEETAL
ncbi:uncharacterized protein [Panulirus ornatus]|uniref:uncharacterized protein n=1 Tax=Panulirus ornatus TaxID=150431 RepID=UPI003A895C46